MNGDHPEDNLLIARAFGRPEATASTMVGLRDDAGLWRVVDADGEHELSVAWPNGPIAERPEIRREIVALYHAACEALGVPAREEHQPAAEESHAPHAGEAAAHGHGTAAHGHGASPHGHGASADDASDSADAPFSRVIRETSWSDHSDSEGATFMEDIMRGRGSKQDYIDLVAQHYFMYDALEAAAEQVAGEAAFAGFHLPALVRMPALEADLAYLIGDDWRERISATPATAAYAARIREVAAAGWVPGVVAHHYTRYLGDLSGGQMIAKLVAKQHEFSNEGIAFYDFTGLGSIAGFKNEYRAALDRLGAELDDAERTRMLDEVRAAYGFNSAVFADLGRQKAAA